MKGNKNKWGVQYSPFIFTLDDKSKILYNNNDKDGNVINTKIDGSVQMEYTYADKLLMV